MKKWLWLFGFSLSFTYLVYGQAFGATEQAVDLVSGAEFVAGANINEKNIKADGTIFVPDGVSRVRAVVVLVEALPGAERSPLRPFIDLAAGRFRDQAWRRLCETSECALLHLRLGTIRAEPSPGIIVNGVVVRNGVPNRIVRNAAEGGTDALLMIMQRLGDESGHQEVKDCPLLLWGWSAAASFGTTFAELYSERTIAFIRYHTHLRGLSPNVQRLKNIPALLIAGQKDETAGTEDAETLWRSGRAAGAPWTFAIEPGATHADEERFVSSHELMIPWIAAVLRDRLEPGSARLAPVRENTGWFGENRTMEIAPDRTFSGAEAQSSWLPDEPTARAWRNVVSKTK